MKKIEDFLVELLTEELPPKRLRQLSEAFCQEITNGLKKENLDFVTAAAFATPRRIAVLVTGLAYQQPDQTIEKKGPAVAAAFDAAGQATSACLGFARSLGVTPAELIRLQSEQGEWVGFRQTVPGKNVNELMPDIIKRGLSLLPIPKRMRWNDGDAEFVRPVHGVIMLYGDQIIPAELFGIAASRSTCGHRFYAPGWMTIPHASAYATLLETEGNVIAAFDQRRELIREGCLTIAKKISDQAIQVLMNDDLLDEVTGIVEWPYVFFGRFEERFLTLPKEVLISAMEDHQRYFPVASKDNKLLPYFILISNVGSARPERIIQGNERVLRARLADAAFFYAADQKHTLEVRVEALKGIVFQARLGTLFDKVNRLQALASWMAQALQGNSEQAARAALLAKSDLTTLMVGEFPELQGVMGEYYAAQDGETPDVAVALREQYLPRFAGDELPKTQLGCILALADRIDLLVGAFGMHQVPTGDKDPFGLRRAAIGLLRILIENQIDMDLSAAVSFAMNHYGISLPNQDTHNALLTFIEERMRAWYQEQGLSADVFAAVGALHIHNPRNVDERIKAVQAFKNLNEAQALSIANKRVSNILTKYAETLTAKTIDPTIFEFAAEQELARQLEMKSDVIKRLYQSRQYDEVLLKLSELRQPIDDFFDQVMVMTEDKERRENRILLLSKLRSLFLQVADIALLQ